MYRDITKRKRNGSLSPSSMSPSSSLQKRKTKKQRYSDYDEKAGEKKIHDFINKICPTLEFKDESYSRDITHYDSSTYYSDFILKYLVKKYKYGGKISNFHINVLSSFGVSEGFTYALSQNEREMDNILNEIQDLLSEGKNGIIEIVIIFDNNVSDSHSNFILVHGKSVEYFEPHGVFTFLGSDKSYYETIYVMHFMNKMAEKLKEYTQRNLEFVSSNCSNKGCQLWESAAELLRYPEMEDEGYCTLWTIFFMELYFSTKLKLKEIVSIVFHYLVEKTGSILSVSYRNRTFMKIPTTYKEIESLLIRYNKDKSKRNEAITLNQFSYKVLEYIRKDPSIPDEKVLDDVLKREKPEDASLLRYNYRDFPFIYNKKIRQVRNFVNGISSTMGLERVPRIPEKLLEDGKKVDIIERKLGNVHLELIRCYARFVESKMKKYYIPKLSALSGKPYEFKELIDKLGDYSPSELSLESSALTPVTRISTPNSIDSDIYKMKI